MTQRNDSKATVPDRTVWLPKPACVIVAVRVSKAFKDAHSKEPSNVRAGTRHWEVPPRGESKSAAPHSQWRNQRFEPGVKNFSERGPLAIVWACNN